MNNQIHQSETIQSIANTVHNLFKHAHSHAQINLGLNHITDYTVNYHITPHSVSLQSQFTIKYTFVVPS